MQDGYIDIEHHYQNQLKHSMQKSQNLQKQISHKNEHGQIGLLWSENESTAKELEYEREKRNLLEASYKDIEFRLNTEIQKRQLLESQCRRLTAELTKYLDKQMEDVGVNEDENEENKSVDLKKLDILIFFLEFPRSKISEICIS